MASSCRVRCWRPGSTSAAICGYWLISVHSSRIQGLLGLGVGDGLPAIATAFFLLVLVCVIAPRGRWPPWKRIAFLPAMFVAHVLLTIPSASALGVLRRSPDHASTAGEQRGVFLLASLPLLLYSMRQSRVFVSEASDPMVGSTARSGMDLVVRSAGLQAECHGQPRESDDEVSIVREVGFGVDLGTAPRSVPGAAGPAGPPTEGG